MPTVPPIGPTGQYLMGKPMVSGDRGGVYSEFSVISKDPPILGLDFGVEVGWVAQPIEAALHHAQHMRKVIRETFGPLAYDASTFPFRVTPLKDGHIVKTDFPRNITAVAANPHLFLAWADKLEEAVAKLGGQA